MKQLGKLAVRIISLILMIGSLIMLSSYATTYFSNDMMRGLMSFGGMTALAPPITSIIISIILWVLADRIGDWFLGDLDDDISLEVEYPELLDIAIKVIGTVLVVKAIPNLVKFTLLILERKKHVDYNAFYNLMISNLLVPFILLLIGIFLFVKSDLFSKVNRYEFIEEDE